ncbi:arylesterase [Puniceicoccaceae bacterium K14]|nr:arylesterase [Puniceicoccaceae bacterium K14]
MATFKAFKLIGVRIEYYKLKRMIGEVYRGLGLKSLVCLWMFLGLTPFSLAEKKILILGDSLTAGYGVELDEAYPARLQEILDEHDLDYKVIGSGLSGETSAGGLRRVDWVLRGAVDVAIVALGGNDGLRGIDVEDTRKNLEAIVEKIRAKNPETLIVLAGMQMPPNMGEGYTAAFRGMFPDIADSKDVELIPFLLKDVGGMAELNQPDGIHPTPEGHKLLARNVWEVLEGLLEL